MHLEGLEARGGHDGFPHAVEARGHLGAQREAGRDERLARAHLLLGSPAAHGGEGRHGRLAIGPRTHYPGSPEQDRFRHNHRGVCLAVSLTPGAEPDITEVETGSFLWTESTLPLLPGDDPAAALAAALPRAGRRDILLRLTATGRTGLADQDALRRAAASAAPDFAHFDLTTDQLATDYGPADLDAIDRAGALRLAAEALRAEAETDRTAADALARLYAYVREAS